jgi:preprotein translocase subunit SecE
MNLRWDLIVTAIFLAALAGLGYWLYRAGHWGRGMEFLSETKTEMKKVSFPSRDEVSATTIIVIVVSFIFAFYLWFADILIARGYAWIIDKL